MFHLDGRLLSSLLLEETLMRSLGAELVKSMLLRFPLSCAFSLSSLRCFWSSAILSAHASLATPELLDQTSGGNADSFSSTLTKLTSFERIAGLRKDLFPCSEALKCIP